MVLEMELAGMMPSVFCWKMVRRMSFGVVLIGVQMEMYLCVVESVVVKVWWCSVVDTERVELVRRRFGVDSLGCWRWQDSVW